MKLETKMRSQFNLRMMLILVAAISFAFWGAAALWKHPLSTYSEEDVSTCFFVRRILKPGRMNSMPTFEYWQFDEKNSRELFWRIRQNTTIDRSLLARINYDDECYFFSRDRLVFSVKLYRPDALFFNGLDYSKSIKTLDELVNEEHIWELKRDPNPQQIWLRMKSK